MSDSRHWPPRPGINRRQLLTSTSAAAGLWCSGQRALAATQEVIKVAWISPLSGGLSSFGVTDRFAHQLLGPLLSAGLTGHGGVLRRIELTLHDAESSPGKAQSLARELVAAGTHLMLATATPEIVNPVSDVCEKAGVPCVSTVVPWQAWFFARGGDPAKGFNWTYHFFAGLEDFADVYSSLQASAQLGQRTGGLFGDDIDAEAFLKAFPPAFEKKGIELVVPGRVSLSDPDWAGIALKLKDQGIRMVTGVLPPPAAIAFFKAADKVGYQPEMASIAKAFPFHETVAQVYRPGLTLTNEVWWSPAWPFKSALTGTTAQALAAAFERETGKAWLQTLGFSYALLEIAAEAGRSAQRPDREAIRHALKRLSVPTVVGPINWRDRYPSQNVCTTAAVGGQWMRDPKGQWRLEVVDNSRSAFIPTTARFKPS